MEESRVDSPKESWLTTIQLAGEFGQASARPEGKGGRKAGQPSQAKLSDRTAVVQKLRICHADYSCDEGLCVSLVGPVGIARTRL
jgi:hypothetical protein